MNENQSLREQMWDLVYGLLEVDEVAALHQRIKSDPQAARLYAEVRLQADLVKSAAKVEDAPFVISVPAEAKKVQSAAKSRSVCAPAEAVPAGRRGRSPSYRLANWSAGAAAAILLGVMGYGFFGSLTGTPQSTPGMLVAKLHAPESMQSGLSQGVRLRTTDSNGAPASAVYNYYVLNERGDEIWSDNGRTDASGNADFSIPGRAVQPGASLGITATWDMDVKADVTDAQALERAEQLAREYKLPQEATLFAKLPATKEEPLSTTVHFDKDWYEPGETVRFSAHSMLAFSHQDVPTPTEGWRLVASDGTTVPAQIELQPQPGTGAAHGSFQIPQSAASGYYELVAGSGDKGQMQVASTLAVGADAYASLAMDGKYWGLRSASPGGRSVMLADDAAFGTPKDAVAKGALAAGAAKFADGSRGSPGGGAPAPAPAKAPAPVADAPQVANTEASSSKPNEPKDASEKVADEVRARQPLDSLAKNEWEDTATVEGESLIVPVPESLFGKRILVVAEKAGTQVAARMFDGDALADEKKLKEKDEELGKQPGKMGLGFADNVQEYGRVQLPLPPEADGQLTLSIYDRSAEPARLAWRRNVQRASERDFNIQLEQLADASFKVRVTDSSGREVPGALITARMVAADDNEQAANLRLEEEARNGAAGLHRYLMAKKEAKGQEGQKDKATELKQAEAPAAPSPLATTPTPAAEGGVEMKKDLASAEGKPEVAEMMKEVDSLSAAGQVAALDHDAPPSLPQETVLASNEEVVEMRRMASISESASRQREALAWVGRVVIAIAALALLILAIFAAIQQPAQAKVWIPSLALAAAGFGVGFFWLTQGGPSGNDIAKVSPAPPGETGAVTEEFPPQPMPAATGTVADSRESAGEVSQNSERRAEDETLSKALASSATASPAQGGGFGGGRSGGRAGFVPPASVPHGLAPLEMPAAEVAPGAPGAAPGGGAGPRRVETFREQEQTKLLRGLADSELGKKSGQQEPSVSAAPAEKPSQASKRGTFEKKANEGAKPTPLGEGKEDLPPRENRNMKREADLAEAGEAKKADRAATGEKELQEKLTARDKNKASELAVAAANQKQASRRQHSYFWQPALATDAKGEAELDVNLPREPGTYELVIDVHGQGGIGKLRKQVQVPVAPAAARPGTETEGREEQKETKEAK